ncbi:MAG: ABC transporter permease [Litorimonas sp.]
MSSYALQDLGKSFSSFRLWSFITAKTIQIRYRRNLLGMLWLFFSFGIPSFGIAYVLSKLQGLELVEHIPHVMFGFVGWYFVADCLSQGGSALTKNRSMLLQAPLGRSVFSLSMVLEKFMLMLANLVTAVVIVSFFGWRPHLEMVFIPISFLIFAITGLGAVMFLSIICARIRDLSELVSAVVRLSFFFTPIIWSATSRKFSDESVLTIIAKYNPLTYFIDLLRMPMLGTWPTTLTLIVTISIAVGSVILGLIAIQKGGRAVAFFV